MCSKEIIEKAQFKSEKKQFFFHGKMKNNSTNIVWRSVGQNVLEEKYISLYLASQYL